MKTNRHKHDTEAVENTATETPMQHTYLAIFSYRNGVPTAVLYCCHVF